MYTRQGLRRTQVPTAAVSIGKFFGCKVKTFFFLTLNKLLFPTAKIVNENPLKESEMIFLFFFQLDENKLYFLCYL